ncbi:hypothetical protein I3842_05G219200 [Carya illinoinensis]|uniref:Protein FAR1-RELATED SEQUENCE n=1 Tax=Carya illinoinensis TaxID=32201 RepID=A0A922F2B6_CARIL|nr:hypothetical protein I3842_05G219200 [Carya illinoinensis]KAG6714782.1 hypothetical protein I3842_05G219200 [Carya illinoinensis]
MDSNVSHIEDKEDTFCEPDGKEGDEGDNVVEEPKVGMIFSSEEEVRLYYTNYAKRMGFGVSKRSSNVGDDGRLKYFTLACVRQGTSRSKASNVLRPRSVEKMGCKAKINVTLTADGKYTLSSVVLEHTHALSPGKAIFFRCHKKLGDSIKRKREVNDAAGLKVRKNYKSFVHEAGGYENLSSGKKDCCNDMGKARRLQLSVEGVEALRNYFIKMQEKNDKFYYVIDVDNESQLRNVFWADARSRAAYDSFGDVITFDTTYLNNAYRMSFAPFMGVNHHGQLILFGCGLISNEDTETFVWLFNAWLKCMHGQAPSAIITDQDKEMQNAIATVFPRSRHRFCLWHVINKLSEKLGSHSQYEAIKCTIQGFVYDSLSCEEFEQNWKCLLDSYNLRDNAWLDWIYGERHLWVPVYVKNTFWAGLSTTQRSESMNYFFEDCVNSKSMPNQFVEQYNNALRRKVENENAVDFSSLGTAITCITHYPIEKQFQELYTNAKFREVQDEFKGLLYCCAALVTCEGAMYTYQVRDEVKGFEGFIKRTNFCVSFNDADFEVKCSCCLFEFRGILCRHALRVLTNLEKQLLPPKYILDRWRKDLKRRYTLVKSSYDDLSDSPAAQRYDRLTQYFAEIASQSSESEAICGELIRRLELFQSEFLHHRKKRDTSPLARQSEIWSMQSKSFM